MKNKIVKVMMISVTMMMMVTGCKDTTKNSEDTAKSNDVKSIETSVELPQNMTDDFQTEIYYIDSQEESDKCYEALQDRDGKIIIEVVTGTVTGENGDGQIDYQGYIKYHGDLAVGTRVESVMIYNPDNNYIDDIMYRADTIIE